MSITIPDYFYGIKSGIPYFKTANMEVFRYHHRCIEVINEVILNKSLLLFVDSGVKNLKVSREQITIFGSECAFISKGSYIMTERSDFVLDGFESFMVLMSDEFISNFCTQQTRRAPAVIPNSDPMAPWIKFEKSPFLDITLSSLRIFFAYPEQINMLLLENKMQETLLYLLGTNSSEQLLAHMRVTSDERKAKLRRFLERNYMQPWSVKDFAENFGLSESTFKRECKNALGIAPKRWINCHRLDHARQILRNGSVPLTQIAIELGFVDSSHFSRMFRKAFNCTPTDYRRGKFYRSGVNPM